MFLLKVKALILCDWSLYPLLCCRAGRQSFILFFNSQRSVPSLGEDVAGSQQHPVSPRPPSISAAAPSLSSSFSADTSHAHCWMPSGTPGRHGQVLRRNMVTTLSLFEECPTSICCLRCCFYRSQGEQCPPPPPVSWGHVTGLQLLLLGHLKGVVKGLDNPAQKDSVLTLVPAYLVYLQAYYHQLSRQVLSPLTLC